jgi:hypothetical protein
MRVSIFLLLLAVSVQSAHAQHHPPVPPPHFVHCTAAHILCINGLTDDTHWSRTIAVANISIPMPWQGNTIATVSAQYPTVIEWAWRVNTAANLNARLTAIPDLELARFSHLYWLDSHGNMTPLLMLASQKLSAANLVKLRAAFGAAATDPEVATYAPATIHAQYIAAVKRIPIRQSHAAYVAAAKVSRTINAMPTGVAAPNVWMTPYEIYTEYLFAGAETEAEAAFLAGKYMYGALGKAAVWGFSVGTAYYAFGEHLDPDFGPTLIELYGDSAAADFGPINTVTGIGYIDGPIVEVPPPGSGGGGDMAVFQLD